MLTNPEDAAASAEKVETPVKAEEVQPLTKKLELLDVQPEVPVAVETKAPEPASVDDAPDPDEDDLDDLDDMLDEFKPEVKATAHPTIPAPAPPAETAGDDAIPDFDNMTEEDFAKHLQEGMADLLGGMEGNDDLAAQFENMMKEITGGGGLGDLAAFGGAAGPSAPKPSASTAAKDAAGGESFQETIKKTMEKIQQSGDQATAAATEAGDNDILSELMKQLQSGGLEGDGSEEDLSKLLLGMMEQLTNKDILYEPMKELNDKFGPWMEKNKSKTDAKDLERYEKQQKIVKEIVDKFEETGYSDDNVESREYIVERMQLMQAEGQPPADLVGDMATAQEAFGAPDETCNQQ